MSMKKRIAVFLLISLSTFLVGVFATRVAERLLAEQHEPSPWQVLLSFENQDLQGLNDENRSRVRQAAMAVTNQQDSDFVDRFRPAFFRSITNTSGEKRYLLVEEAPLMMIPGDSRLRVHVFNNCGRRLSVNDFNAGSRMVLTGLRIRKAYLLEQDTLIVDSEYCFGGHNARQYYAVVGNRITLIALERDGKWLRNDYQNSNLTVGPRIDRSAGEWEKALDSADEAEVLSALIWLGGQHWNGQAAPYDDDKGDTEKVTALRSRDSVRQRLKQLSESQDYWLRTAAASVLENDK